MHWKTARVVEARYSVTFNSTLPIVTVTIKGVPTTEDAQGIKRVFRSFAAEVNGPWAILSDLREMPIASTSTRKIWVDNIRQAADAGLALWAVVVADLNIAAMQSKNVAEDAFISHLTLVTIDYRSAAEWTNGVLNATGQSMSAR